MKQVQEARQWAKLEVLDTNYTEGKLVKNVHEVDIIEVKEIEPEKVVEDRESAIEAKEIEPETLIHKDELKQYTVKSFRDNLENFTIEELEVFAKFDDRATIIKEARKELKKRK